MAITLGDNAGFVYEAPTADPAGTNTTVDNRSFLTIDTAPAGVNKITEVGWYCDNATEAANFEVGLYQYAGVGSGSILSNTGSLLYTARTNAKGTGAGWKKATGLDWAITPGTRYHIAVQLDDTATTTSGNTTTSGGGGMSIMTVESTLSTPWTDDAGYDADGMFAIYAVVGFPLFQINIAGSWKDISAIQTNFSGSWNDAAYTINIDGNWK